MAVGLPSTLQHRGTYRAEEPAGTSGPSRGRAASHAGGDGRGGLRAPASRSGEKPLPGRPGEAPAACPAPRSAAPHVEAAFQPSWRGADTPRGAASPRPF